MSNFGVSHLRVVNPYELAFREAKSAVGAADILADAAEYRTLSDAVADCSLVIGTTALRNRGLQHEIHPLSVAAQRIQETLSSGLTALLFGSEKRGLSNDDLSHCHWLVSIPTRTDHPSMNLGQAVAVCLYEIARAPELAELAAGEIRTSADQMERITALLIECLNASGYRKPSSGAGFDQKIRRLVRRMDLSHDDGLTLSGMLRQILWKLGRGEGDKD